MILLLLGCVDKGDADSAVCLDCETGTAPTDSAPTDTGTPPICDGVTAAHVAGVPFASVEEAVQGAEAGATVEVCAGTWPASVTLGRDMTVEGADGAILDGGGVGPVVTIPVGVTASLVNLWIGGGQSGAYAGGVVVFGSAEIRECVVADNVGGEGGGVSVLGGTEGPASLTLTYSTVEGNRADQGGGIYAREAVLLVSATPLRNNVATGDGGGFWCGTSSCTFDAAEIRANEATTGGGGSLSAWTAGLVSSCTVEGNSADAGAGLGFHADGAIAPFPIEDTNVLSNAATGEGGGIRFLATSPSPPVTVWGSTIEGNSAADGGGLWIGGASGDPVTIEDSTVEGNTAVRGGGVFLSDTADSLVLTGVDFSESGADQGGAIWSTGSVYAAGGSVTGSIAAQGGGAWVYAGTLVSNGVDWGTGDTDNAVDDIAIADGPTYNAFGAGAFFTCDADGAVTCE